MKVEKNWIEWSVFAIGLAIVGGIVGYLIVSAVRHDDSPPDVIVRAEAARKVSAGYQVPLVVENKGHATAEQVKIEVTLMDGEREIDQADLTFAFVPRKSERRGSVVFERDPACCRVVARVMAFEEP